MGRIKSLMIKKAARELFESEESFNESFEHNKKLLNNTMPYKSVRNKVAGGITKLAKLKKAKTQNGRRDNRENRTRRYEDRG